MVVVAVDTSHMVGSVSVARDGEFIAGDRFGESASHLVGLGRTVDRLLHGQGMGPGDIDRVALVTGPGSFTGLRIGLAWLKGLQAALQLEVVTIGTLELLALPFLRDHATVCTMVDARRNEVYGALYRADTDSGRDIPEAHAIAVKAPAAQDPRRFLEDLPETPSLFIGTGVARWSELVEVDPYAAVHRISREPDTFPSTQHLSVVAHRLEPLPADGVGGLEPDYLRDSSARRAKLGPIKT